MMIVTSTVTSVLSIETIPSRSLVIRVFSMLRILMMFKGSFSRRTFMSLEKILPILVSTSRVPSFFSEIAIQMTYFQTDHASDFFKFRKILYHIVFG